MCLKNQETLLNFLVPKDGSKWPKMTKINKFLGIFPYQTTFLVVEDFLSRYISKPACSQKI